jgi:ketosteroid isomerase-like protein
MTTTTDDLVDQYFEADRRHDAAAVDRLFAPDAVVRDQGTSYEGAAAIRGWRSATASRYSWTTTVLDREPRSAVTVVTARLDGDFPGKTVDLEFAFEERDGLISRLTIG